MIELKFFAEESMCISERDISKLRSKKYARYDAIHDKFGNLGAVKAVPVFVESCGESYLADKTTGSLYGIDDLRCLTGPITLRPIK